MQSIDCQYNRYLFTMIEKHFKNKLQNHCYMRDKVGAVISSKDESEAKEILKYLMLKSIFFVKNIPVR